jgi:hypothetical protein
MEYRRQDMLGRNRDITMPENRYVFKGKVEELTGRKSGSNTYKYYIEDKEGMLPIKAVASDCLEKNGIEYDVDGITDKQEALYAAYARYELSKVIGKIKQHGDNFDDTAIWEAFNKNHRITLKQYNFLTHLIRQNNIDTPFFRKEKKMPAQYNGQMTKID